MSSNVESWLDILGHEIGSARDWHQNFNSSATHLDMEFRQVDVAPILNCDFWGQELYLYLCTISTKTETLHTGDLYPQIMNDKIK